MKCSSNKNAFSSKTEALHAASQHQEKAKRDGGDAKPFRMKAERCQECKNWHLTKRYR